MSGTPARQPEYLLRLPEGGLIYVSADPTDDYYNSFRLFIGDGTVMREVPVTDVERYRDGGTTFVETAEETLCVPSPFTKDARPSWGDQNLEKLDPSGLEISESSTTVTFGRPAERERAPATEEMPKPAASRQQTHDMHRHETTIAQRAAETPTPARKPDVGYGF